MMKKMKVSKEFIEEVNKLKRKCVWVNSAMDNAYYHHNEYKILNKYLFGNELEIAGKNQLTFAKIWAGEIELVEKEEQYIVWVKGSKTKKKWASFMHVEDDNTIDISYDSLFDMAKGNPGFHFSKEKAFKLRDTGYFEIERVDE